MLHLKCFREQLTQTAALLAKRGFKLEIEKISALEKQRKHLQIQTESLQNERNALSKKVGELKIKKQDPQSFLDAVQGTNTALLKAQAHLERLQTELNEIYSYVPNLLHHSVPSGQNESDNREMYRYGKIREFDFPIKDHVDLGAQKARMDFESAAKITGSRFVVLKAELARLQRALIQFMLDTHTREHGYTEYYVPYLVNRLSLEGTGQLPKFEADQFFTQNEPSYALIPTAEVPLTNLVRNVILSEKQLPLKLTAHTSCFRKEAGSYGKDMRGMIRQHQFEKIELVQIVHPDRSYEALEEILHHAETILKKLDLPYRVMNLCSGDIGFSAAKTYDIEVWFPSQKAYREISSCSNFEAFQARRLKARWRTESEKHAIDFVHTLNGSGLAVGRTLIAIMENYQEADGSFTIPSALQNYLGGLKKII